MRQKGNNDGAKGKSQRRSGLRRFLGNISMFLKVLFLGNSHTYLHYMPRTLVGLVKAENSGFDLEVDQRVGEGVSLEWHWNDKRSRRRMREKKWDYIVLQDRSGGPLEEPASFQKYAGLLDGEIKKLGSRTIFYLTWANLSLPETQKILTESYSRMAAQLDAVLAPVGPAWAKVRNMSPDLRLHHRDGRHASPVGAYLTACVFYSILFDTSPVGLPANLFIEGKMRPEQDDAQALVLQKAAWETVTNIENRTSNIEF
jgi:hypothetical protein